MTYEKQATCDVSLDLPRVDVIVDGILYRAAALHGAGGVMGGGGPNDWVEIPKRVRLAAARAETLRIYTVHAQNRVDAFDVAAASLRLVAVYAPGYDAPNNWRRR